MLKRNRKNLSKKRDTYQVCITILEAKHLVQNSNPLIVVKVGNQKKKTLVRERTDNPHFNDYFIFDVTCDFEMLLSTRIMISVYLRNCLRQIKFYGGIVFEVATVWDQPDHQYFHKWALLTNPKDPKAGPKGYVKCNISVHARGEQLKLHPETDGDDDIEGNLLLPIGEQVASRQRARYILVIYRADGLSTVRASSCCGSNNFGNINPYVQISFAGMKASTIEQKNTYTPRFNEKIIFREMFPPLSHRIRITIKDRIHTGKPIVIAAYILNLRKVSNSGEYGFLPTFGPSFIHFYRAENSAAGHRCISNCSPTLPVYCGRVLLSLKTEIEDPEASSTTGVEVQSTSPIIEQSLWKTEEYLLVGIFYDVCMIDRSRFKSKSISFEISLGNAGNRQFHQDQHIAEDSDAQEKSARKRSIKSNSQTPMRTTGTYDGKYNYLPLGSNKPCVYVKSWWPNMEWRITNQNNLSFIANYLETELEKIETLISVEYQSVHKTYNDTIDCLKYYCMRYLHTLNVGRYDEEGGTTKLDRHRVNLCRREIEDVLKMININGNLSDNQYIKIALAHAYKYLHKIREICEDPQHNLPDIFIWMIAGLKRVAYARLPASSIIYAEDGQARGEDCGQRINLFMKNLENRSKTLDYSACKTEVFLWLGNAKFTTACWSAIPPGYDVDHKASPDVFPRFVKYVQFSKFQLRAHIFQGRFDPGMDYSGLLDPLVRVIFHGYTLSTKVIKQSLNPFWNQTLVFPPINLYGTREHVKSIPPKVIVEAFDEDLCGIIEFCGRCVATPVVKLNTESYVPPDFPPKLTWYKLISLKNYAGSILAAFELIEIGNKEIVDIPLDASITKIYQVPNEIRPRMTSHRLEVIFWGVRDMKKLNFVPVHKPRIIVECAGILIKSDVMENAKNNCNFENNHFIINLELPEEIIYYPSITIKAYDSRGFGCFKYCGVCVMPTAYIFLQELITEEDYANQIFETKLHPKSHSTTRRSPAVSPISADYDLEREESVGLISYKKLSETESHSKITKITDIVKRHWIYFGRRWKADDEKTNHVYKDDETFDWWSKYYASLELYGVMNLLNSAFPPLYFLRHGNIRIHFTAILRDRNVWRKIYECSIWCIKLHFSGRKDQVARANCRRLAPAEKDNDARKLEMQPQFSGFEDRLKVFELHRGKKTGDQYYDENNFAGKFKGYITIYRWLKDSNLDLLQKYKSKSGRNVADGLCSDYPLQEPVHLLVRLYIVKGIGLRPSDPLSGKSDPYLKIVLGKNFINDRKNYKPNQLDPVFGKLFEIEATFPMDYLLTIQVWDHDATSSDDFIGETMIDIENRFYSKHRAHCGISKVYNSAGYNVWRDREKPTRILALLCQKNNLPSPEYLEDCVEIGKKKFSFLSTLENNVDDKEEHMALNVLWQWQEFPICGCALVPEHIERRPLFNPKRPGLEQGKLELWVDIFRIDDLPSKPAVDIRPQSPKDYEIRITIWNTEAVPLVDNQFLTGEKCSDIYVKGWIQYEDLQKTDVHYNSLNGEGNFNWRFVFRVTYSTGERLMIVRKKTSVFARNETEQKLPCKLNIQVWDSDHFSADDFLGSLTLNLSKIPRGSANSKNCTLKIMDPSSPTVNLFKVIRTKGWWPFSRSIDAETYVQAGKVEMEIIALPSSEADEQPVGKGRNSPDPLPPPNRPDTSFSWFRNPWKACCFVVCRYYKWRILCCLFIVLLVLLIAFAIYAFPGYLVKRLLGA